MTPEGRFERTDIWREGKWLDLWSVVHFLSGISLGLAMTLLSFGAIASVVIALLLLVAYEMWEAIVKIHETPQNRFMDVVVGMVSFLPTFFFLNTLSAPRFILLFGLVLTANIVLSIFGWLASRKADEFEEKMRLEVERGRERFLRGRARFLSNRERRRRARLELDKL